MMKGVPHNTAFSNDIPYLTYGAARGYTAISMPCSVRNAILTSISYLTVCCTISAGQPLANNFVKPTLIFYLEW